MSTILDALRKAQEETRGGRESRVDTVPGADGPRPPRRRGPRRLVVWVATVLGVLVAAFVGGRALGHRVSDFFAGAPETADVPSGQQIAAQEQQPADAAAAPPLAQAAPVAPAVVARIAAEHMAAARNQANAAPASGEQPAAPPEAGLTPAGRLHVFGAAAGGPAAGKDVSEQDRAARLQQLRERMLRARQDARGAAGADKTLVPIIVPPPREQVQRAAKQPAVAVAGSDDGTAPDAAARPAVVVSGAENAPPPARKAEPVRGAAAPGEPGEVAAAPAETAAVVRDALAAVGAGAVGVSVSAGHGDSGAGESRDADTAAPRVGAKAAAEPPPSTTVASLPPPAAAAPAQPPVLRRAPGGAPQVAINILQWSVEPGRRFAFVSVDGGGMIQVREGDHIGGLIVKHIHEQTIEFGYNDSSFLLRAN